MSMELIKAFLRERYKPTWKDFCEEVRKRYSGEELQRIEASLQVMVNMLPQDREEDLLTQFLKDKDNCMFAIELLTP